jgi:hypothetical protein
MAARAAEAAAASAGALVLTLLVAAPVLRAPSERIFGMEIVGRQHDPFTVMQQFASPIAIGAYSQPLTDVPGAWLARASGPVAAYNWLVLLSFPLSAASAYLLARYLTLSPPGAFIAAIAFAFSPFHLAHAAYHPHIAQTQWIPLYLLALWRCLDDSTPAAIGLLVLSIAGVTLSNFYGGLIAAVLTPVAAAAYWFFASRSRPGSRRRLAVTAGVLIVAAGCGAMYAWYAAHAVIAGPSAFAFPRSDLFKHSAKWWGYLVPPVEHPLLGRLAARVWTAVGVHDGLLEQQVSLGAGVVALGVVAIVAWVGGDRRARPAAIVPVLATVACVALVCSLSPERTIGPFTFVRPSAFLYRVVPMFRAYARFGVVVQLMAALLAGIGAERLWRANTRRAQVACVVLLALAAGEYAVWPPAMWRDVLPTAAHRWAAGLRGSVHVLDCAPLTVESASIPWLTNGRIAMSDGPLADCMEPNFPDKLAAAGYTHLLVRRATPDGEWLAGRHAARGLQEAACFPDAVVFAVTAPPPPVYTARLTGFYPREHDATRTWRWMAGAASWTIVNATGRPTVADVGVEMTAFHGARRLTLRLDGADVQTLTIAEPLAVTRIGPLTLTPGEHVLAFQPIDPPTVAADVLSTGDLRPLSFGVGAWHWTLEGSHP